MGHTSNPGARRIQDTQTIEDLIVPDRFVDPGGVEHTGEIGGGSTDETYVTVDDESSSLENSQKHADLTGSDLHDPASHGNEAHDETYQTENDVLDDLAVEMLVRSPNAQIPSAELNSGDSIEITHNVPDGDTLEVFLWGAYTVDGTTNELRIRLLDGSDTVQAESTALTTPRNESTDPNSPIASHTNTSGSNSVFKLAIVNTGDNDLTDPGVGGMFGYRVV